MDNTSQYLRKEVEAVEAKIDYARSIVLKELGIDINSQGTGGAGESSALVEEIRELEDEEDDEDDEEEYEPRNHDVESDNNG